MIDEHNIVRICEKEMTTPFEPGLRFRKIHSQRLGEGWYVVCMIYKVMRHQYDTTESYKRMRRKLTIVGEFIVDAVGEIRSVDYCHDVPPIDPFGDRQFEYTKSKLFSRYEEMKTFLKADDKTSHRCLN